MIRFTLLAAFVAAGCGFSSAEIRCGKSLCGVDERCEPTKLVCVVDEAPLLIITEPRVGSLIAGDTLMLSGDARDDNGAITLELSLDEGKTWASVPAAAEHFTARVALPTMDFQPLTLLVRARDSAQQASAIRVALTIDNVAPSLTVGAPLDGATLNAAWFAALPKIHGVAADGSGLSAVSVDVGSGPVAVTPVGDQFSYPWAAPVGEDGVAHEVRVTAVDLAGNRTVISRKVTVDVVAPVVTFTVPAIDALLGEAFFAGGGQVKGEVTLGAKVTADFGQGAQPATVTGSQWSAVYAPDAGLDFQQELLEVVAEDAAGNAARAVRTTTVDRVAPVLTFTAPAMGARLNAADFPAGDDVAVGWTVSDGDPQVVVRDGTSVVTSLKVATSPSDNPKGYALTLTAQDRAGNSSQSQLAFAVDRLRPSVIARVPASDARNVASAVSVDFSEDVTGAAGLTLTPAAAAGTWTTPRHFEISGLPADAVFSSTVPGVVDAFGNPSLAVAPVKLHTAPALPVTGTLMTDVARFKAAADADGVLTLFTTSPGTPATFRWARVNPKTGVVENNRPAWLPVVGGDFTEVAAYAESQVLPDLSARRVSAATTLLPSTITERRAWVRENDAVATTSLGMVGVVPMRPFAGEGSGLADVGFLKHSAGAIAYSRPGMSADLGVGLGAPTAMGFAENRWELVEVRNQVLKHRAFACSAPFANAPATCELGAIGQWSDLTAVDAASYAIGEACSVYAYNSTSGKRLLKIAANCAGLACPLPTSSDTGLANELRVASDRRESNSFVAAMRVVGGIQLMRLPLDADCKGAFVNVGPVVAVPATAAFEPISLGGKPALVYVDTGNVLKVFVP